MSNLPVDRDTNYMKEMWGTTKLSTDYNAMTQKKTIREFVYDDLTPVKHDLSKQTELHEKIRNDEDYDDWEYGTEPTYGKITM